MRPYWIKQFYVIFIPFSLVYSTCYAISATKLVTAAGNWGSVFETALVPIVSIVSVTCYVLIRRHFRAVAGYTEKVRQMQTRLATSIYLQVSDQGFYIEL
ncbi:unnamed protein product [Strongylus vulgaris]|uniref:Uncharacterized protein n=1 Tax=Strongylus vulgaris TaxID=40348 RepID=A0A3P7J7T1_STRVU|nr:unnamed protein product [Strongylus vulgaris]